METFAREGLAFSAEQEAQLRKAEEEIIQKEILPIITEKIEPVLAQIERELVLVVDYVPNAPLKVSISRKRNLQEMLTDAVELTPDPQVAHNNHNSRPQKRKTPGSKTRLKVIFPDGTTICHPKAKDTFIEVIECIGAERVRSLNLKFCKVPIVSNTRDTKYGQHAISNGWLILTHSSTADKKNILTKINDAFNLHLKIDIV